MKLALHILSKEKEKIQRDITEIENCIKHQTSQLRISTDQLNEIQNAIAAISNPGGLQAALDAKAPAHSFKPLDSVTVPPSAGGRIAGTVTAVWPTGVQVSGRYYGESEGTFTQNFNHSQLQHITEPFTDTIP